MIRSFERTAVDASRQGGLRRVWVENVEQTRQARTG